jgi:hypothetical protein
MRERRTEWIASGTSSVPIAFQEMPGSPRPTMLGYNKIDRSQLRLTGLSFKGPTEHVNPLDQGGHYLPGADNLVVNDVIWNNGSGSLTSDMDDLTPSRDISAAPRFTGQAAYPLLPGSPASGRALDIGQAVG